MRPIISIVAAMRTTWISVCGRDFGQLPVAENLVFYCGNTLDAVNNHNFRDYQIIDHGPNGEFINYEYDGVGNHLKTEYTENGRTVEVREYTGAGHVLTDGKVTRTLCPGGYFPGKGGYPRYYLTDYQGNNIATLSHQGLALTTHRYYPYGEPWREPTAEDYLYSANERIRYGGINEYDFHARSYHASLPRFDKQDPLAEIKPWISPYSYCSGDPVNKIDRNGMTDFYNEENNWHTFVDDGRNQVLSVTTEQYNLLQSQNFDPNTSEYADVLDSGVLRTDLLYTVENVLEGEKFVSYKDTNDCLVAAKEQNNGETTGAGNRIDMYNTYNNTFNYEEGVEYLQEQLTQGNAVIAGVNYAAAPDPNNHNKSTNHFLNIVGMGFQTTENGPENYFSYYDNGTSRSERGTNLKLNRFTIRTHNGYKTRYLHNNKNLCVGNTKRYIVSELRRNR